jgi:hypothetical protein
MAILFPGSNKALRRKYFMALVICIVNSLAFITTTDRFLSYNNLPPETSLPVNEDEEEHLVHLRSIICDCNASSKVGVIALHQHEKLLPDHSLVGCIEQVNKSCFYWITEFSNERINLDKVWGYKFAYVEGKGLCPFEFRQGQMIDLSGVDKSLIFRICQYLVNNHLASRFGLMLLIPELSKNEMTEFPMHRGMVQVPTKVLLPREQMTVTTGWHCDIETGIFRAWDQCVILKDGNHVWWEPETKTHKEPINFHDAVSLLEEATILRLRA